MRKELKLEIFELPEVRLYGFKLNNVSFLFDADYKEKTLLKAERIPDEDADVFLFRETSITKLNEYTYFLGLSLFYDTVVVRRKKKPITENKIVADSWYNIVKKEGERTLHIPFSQILSVYEEGVIMFEFDICKEEMFVLKTKLNNFSKLIPFNP